MADNGKYNRKWLRLVGAVYPVISVVCFVFPFIPRYFINKALEKLKGFKGRISSIRISPFVIDIRVSGLFLDQVNATTNERTVFISAESIEIKIDWIKLWSGTLAAELQCTAPTFTLVKENFGGSMSNPLFGLDLGMDIVLRKATVENAKLEFADDTAEPKVLMQMEHINLGLTNLVIKKIPDEAFLTEVVVRADLYQGRVDANMKVNLFSRTPDFNLNAGISDVNMTLLNDFFKAYGNFDIHSGFMNMHTEIEARGGAFKGYVESIIKELQIMGPEDSKDTIGRYLLKSLISVAAGLLEDHTNDELAARIEFQENFKNPEIHIGRAVSEVLANAFVHGLTPYMKNEVKINI